MTNNRLQLLSGKSLKVLGATEVLGWVIERINRNNCLTLLR